jgi:molecular chaperone DnaK
MSRTTIDYGIDLGTTNSAVAVLNGTEPEVVKNNEQQDVTASAVYVDKAGRVHVGRRARERAESDPSNTASEFKLRMGTKGQASTFATTGRTMEPEELSAEVLKSLRDDVRQRCMEDITAAVITVPAAFELNQCEATKRAAEKAGLTFAPLLQEPTAAALAYGFQSDADNRFWLVYDFGGGTFDASIVQLKDGEFTVVTHRGDNFLGGKLIDWAIVDKLLVPALVREHPLTGFGRSERKWLGAIAKLKLAAEEAKIVLSRQESTEVAIDYLCDDDRGRRVEVELELTRRDIEGLAEPMYTRSLTICRQALEEARLGAGGVERVLLVGGPTLAPHLRETLQAGLGITLDVSQDPMTVVARGAAVFAGTQRLQADTRPPATGHFAVDLEYSPIGAEVEPFVGGKVRGSSDVLPADLTVQFVNTDARPAWQSGKLPVSADGGFVTTLFAEKGRRNVFRISLADGSGRPLHVTPDELVYTVGAVESRPLLTHGIGLGLTGNEMLAVFERGSALPCRRTVHLKTTVLVRRGSGAGMIRVPVLEGERSQADRNRNIGVLEVRPDQVERDLPAGSQVEVTIDIDASRLVNTSAFVPLLDAEFDKAIDLATEAVPDADELQERAAQVRVRHRALEARATNDPRARSRLEQVEAEGVADDVTSLAEAAPSDTDAATECAKRILDFEAQLDEVDEALRWPDLVREAEDLIDVVREVVEKTGDDNDQRDFADRQRETRQAIETGDVAFLDQRCEDLRRLLHQVLKKTGILDLNYFAALKEQLSEMLDLAKAERLISEGERAIDNDEMMILATVNQQLRLLLPEPPPPPDSSTVMRDSG